MIVNGLIDLAYGFASAALTALPTSDPESYAGIGTAFAQGMAANQVVPVGTALACVATVLAFNVARLSFWFFGWILKHIPVIG